MPLMPENPAKLPAEKLSLGCPILDHLLGGGIPFGFVTELAGEASAGKTQLCLQILISAASPRSPGGLSAASLFISSEPPFPLRRLISLSSCASILDHIFIRSAFTPEELFAVLRHIDVLLSFVHFHSGRRIRLLIIDSVAAIFHTDAEDAVHRSSDLFTVVAKLKQQARRFNLAVIVTNHVVDVIEDGGSMNTRFGSRLSLSSSGRTVSPAMGLAWANCVNMRLFLSKTSGEGNAVSDGSAKMKRNLQVVFAPHLPECSCEFVIKREGVFGL